MTIPFPSPDAIDRRRFDQLMRLEAPTTTYVIYFTPRSGSTWLTDLCAQTGVLGSPGEHFNEVAIRQIPMMRHAANIEEYAALLMRRRNHHGVFGFEITYTNLMRTFESQERFLALFGGATAFWLTRSDIVRQALSIVKHKHTQLGKKPVGEEAAHEAAEDRFFYDADAIRRASTNLVNLEKQTLRFFRAHGITPVALNYETMVSSPPIDVANSLIRGIGARPLDALDFKPTLRRTGTAKNDSFADRFRAENSVYLNELEERRVRPLSTDR